MKKFASIEQFRNVIREVKSKHDYKGKDEEGNAIYRHESNYPTLKFRGTVKLHGTNAGVVKYSDGRIEFQSRERILSLDDDNNGFMNQMMSNDFSFVFDNFKFNDYIAVFGEWCGGSIQKGIAINGVPKMFVIFAIKIDDEWIELPNWVHSNDNQIYNILQFGTYEIDIDFNNPELIQNKLIEMTVAVEEQCPVGKFFGVEGIGEGIVFSCVNDYHLRFKSKGEKHSVTKVKTLNAVDVEMITTINEFVDTVVTENRLKQGISYFYENNILVDSKNTGEFLRWVVNDVLKEERDSLDASGLDEKKVKNSIVNKARTYFMNQL